MQKLEEEEEKLARRKALDEKMLYMRYNLPWSGLYPLQFLYRVKKREAKLRSMAFGPIKFVAALMIMLSHSFRFAGQDLITWFWPGIDPERHSAGNIGLSVLLITSGYLCAQSAYDGDRAHYGMELHPLVDTAKSLSRRVIRILFQYFTMIWVVAIGLFVVSTSKASYFGYSSKTWVFISEMTLIHPWTAFFANPLSMPVQSLPGVWG